MHDTWSTSTQIHLVGTTPREEARLPPGLYHLIHFLLLQHPSLSLLPITKNLKKAEQLQLMSYKTENTFFPS